MNKKFGSSRGQIMVLYAGAIVALVGVLSLCADVAVMYVNWQQLQKTADAAAIAGASYLTETANTFGGTPGAGCSGDDAQKAACTYAVNNGLAASQLNPAIAETATTVQVSTQNANVPYLFAKVLGMNAYTIGATAIASIGPPNTVPSGLFPVGLECKSPCNLGNLDPGQSVQLGVKFANGLSPGNWEWLAPDGSGGSTLKSTIENGSSQSFSVGDQIAVKSGQTNGPVTQGLANRISKCPAVSPDPCSGSNPTNIPPNDPCDVIVPAVDFTGTNGSSSTLTIEGFAEIYIDPAGTTANQINGCFVGQYKGTTVAGGTNTPALGPVAAPVLIR